MFDEIDEIIRRNTVEFRKSVDDLFDRSRSELVDVRVHGFAVCVARCACFACHHPSRRPLPLPFRSSRKSPAWRLSSAGACTLRQLVEAGSARWLAARLCAPTQRRPTPSKPASRAPGPRRPLRLRPSQPSPARSRTAARVLHAAAPGGLHSTRTGSGFRRTPCRWEAEGARARTRVRGSELRAVVSAVGHVPDTWACRL